MTQRVLRLLENPEIRGLSADDPRAIEVYRRVIQTKPLLWDVYRSFYREFVKVSGRVPPGPQVEVGSGGGFLKQYLSSVITSDILDLPHVDRVFAAESIPMGDATVSAFFLLDVFHHLRDPGQFLGEVQRCLKPGGRLVMIEPANTLWGRFVRRNFHHEPFDDEGGWEPVDTGRSAPANLALPWIVFVRDRGRFEEAYPELVLVRYEPHTPFRFLLSGGISYRTLVPRPLIPVVKLGERLARPLNRWLGMHVTIEVEKRGRGAPWR